MLSPSVMLIEIAIDTYFKNSENISDWLKKSQIEELQSLGDQRVQIYLGASGISNDLIKGYELGLATARIVLSGNMALVKAGIKPSEIL